MEINPQHHGYPRNPKTREIHMHAKTSEETMHTTWYLQSNLFLFVDLDVHLHFPSCFSHQLSTLSKTDPRKIWVSNSMRGREINERAPKCTAKKVPTDSQKPFYRRGFYFLHFPPHMQPVTFYLPFLLIFTILINKCVKNTFFFFNDLAIAFANFLIYNKPCEHPH